MPNDSYTQQALAVDARFRQRVRAQLSSVAWQVQNEDPSTANHEARERYARLVIRQLDSELSIILPTFVMRPNVFNFETTYVYDFPLQVGQVVSATGDPDIASQLFADWNAMAAAAGFTALGPPVPPGPQGLLPPLPPTPPR